MHPVVNKCRIKVIVNWIHWFTFQKGYIVSRSIIMVFLFKSGKSPLIDRVRMFLSSSDKSSKAISSDCSTYTFESS